MTNTIPHQSIENGISKVNYILTIDNNLISNLLIEKKLREVGFEGEIKMSLNINHAMLYIEQLHLNQKLNNNEKLVIFLNIEIPIMYGLEFLKKYNNLNTLKKENIMIAVIQSDSNNEKINKAKNLGVCNFLPRTFSIAHLNEMVSNYFFGQASLKRSA